jgi:DNA-binding winged helix-turn-helix (wHTH) protein/TolB-like protein
MTAESDRPDFKSPVDLAREVDFSLGASRVSPSTREVLRGADREFLEPRVMQVLVALFQANGRVVSRDELISRCWEGRIVGEDAINRAIGRLRRLSEVDREASFVIETIPRVGYRLTAAPAPASTNPRSEVSPEAMRPAVLRRRAAPALWAALAVIAVAAPGLWLFRDRPPWTPKPSEGRVAVLSFDTIGPGTELRGVADGLLNEIVSQLSNIQIQAVSPTESKDLRGGDVKTIDRLGADMVLDGAVQGEGKAIDVRVHLDDVREHVVLWSGEFHGSADATEALEARVAAQAAEVLNWAKIGRTGKVTLDAPTLAALIDARVRIGGGSGSFDVGEADYRKVVAAAPDFSWGHSGVAMAEEFELRAEPARSGADAKRADVRLEAKRALTLEPHNGEAWMALEYLAPLFDWRGREELLIQGVAADPNFEPIVLLEGRLLWLVGRGRDALPWFRRAHDIDPLRVGDIRTLALSLASDSRVAESRAFVAQMELQWPALRPTRDARFWTGVIAGATNDVLTQLNDPAARPRDMDQVSVDAWRGALMAIASKDAKVRADAIKKVTDATAAGSISAGQALTLLAMLGDLDGAFAQAALYAPADPSEPPYLFLPTTAAMRSDPRFIQLAAQLGLVAYWRATGHWPDFCADPGLPYNCQAEATRISAAK